MIDNGDFKWCIINFRWIIHLSFNNLKESNRLCAFKQVFYIFLYKFPLQYEPSIMIQCMLINFTIEREG